MKKFAFLIIVSASLGLRAQQALFIPDTLVGPTYTLNLHRDSVQFLPGQVTQTNGFNSYSYLGPTLLLNDKANVSMVVNNQLADTSTIHWHGLHVAAMNDGGPHTPILAASVWNPQFKVMNAAATYWYHPHLHMKTAVQAMRGAAGLIIVRDSAEATLALPRRYGLDDFPVIVQSHEFDTLNQINPDGMQDSVVLVNGRVATYTDSVFANVPAQVIRMRLLNAAGERTFNFGFTGNKPFYVIGNDGGLLQAPVQVTRIWLSPGERAEILLDLGGMNGQTIYLMSYASELPTGVQGGPTMPMGGGPPMDSPLNGVDFNILKLNVGPQTSSPVTSIPSALVPDVPLQASQAQMTRSITFTAQSMMDMDGPFFFNGLSFDMNRIDYQIPLNNIEIWELTNQTMVAHPFHIHDINFYLLDRDGNAPLPAERGKKDVVLVQSMETVRFITQFTDFADSLTPYMHHCHILVHEDDGMMGQFVVMPQGWVSVKNQQQENMYYIFPNPASDELTIMAQKAGDTQVSVYNILGEQVAAFTSASRRITIPTREWAPGMYTVGLMQEGKTYTKKIIVR
jgi:blue copper oxidase